MFSITCQCGHTGPFDDFTRTPISGELPKNEYQCPACQRAWKIVPKDRGFVSDSGFYFPPTLGIKKTQGKL